MTQRRTRTGARRSGDDYQDLVAADVLLRVLKHPSRYRWVKFEAREAGKLDDVIVLRSDGTIEATQVKFSTDALRTGDPWTWEKLLDKSGGKESLIQAWSESVVLLDQKYGATEPQLVSNRRAGEDFVLTPKGLVAREKTPESVLERLESQLGDRSNAFLERFRFHVDEQDLGDLDEKLLRDFEALGLPEGNWPSFKDAIRAWMRGDRLPETGEIRVEDIRNACGWRLLSPLSQNLEIPADYTLPLPRFHDAFLQRVDEGDGSVIVLSAGPGLGKSTYLSYLVKALRDQGCPVIRHHYSLRTGSDSFERLDSVRVAESLMADIESKLGSYRDRASSKNPRAGALGVWLREVGLDLDQEGRHLVVVVDGLDHVWRGKESREELTLLFEQLLPVPQGVVVVVGTQPVEDRQLPAKLLERAPRDQWVALPRLDKQAIADWLSHHDDLMPQPRGKDGDDWYRSDLAECLQARTGGHPLLLRYAIERIAHDGEQLTIGAIEAIPETPTDSLEEYYRALWLSLPEEARDVVFLLAMAEFPWPDSSLLECLRLLGYERGSSTVALAAVRHLLVRDALGDAPFHRSILHFAKEQPEFVARAPVLRNATIAWLESQAPDYWRRSHLWLLQRDGGNASPLMDGADRNWAVEAAAAGHPLDEIATVLKAAAWEAIDRAEFPTYVDRGVSADAVVAATRQDEVLRWMYAAQLLLGTDDFLETRGLARVSELSDQHVLVLARHMHERGSSAAARDCFNEVNRRLEREYDELDGADDQRERLRICAELAGMVGIEAGRFATFVANFTSEDVQTSIAESWVVGLSHSRDVHSALQVLKELPSEPVRRILSRHVAVLASQEGVSLSTAQLQLLAPPYAWVYRWFSEGTVDDTPLDEPVLPAVDTSYSFGEYTGPTDLYVHDLFFFVLIRELQSPGSGGCWQPPEGMRPWLAGALEALVRGACDVAEGLRDADELQVTEAYDATPALSFPPWDDDMADRQSAFGTRSALRTITEDLLALRGATGARPRLEWANLESIASHNFASFSQVLQWVVAGTAAIEREAFRSLCAALEDELAARVQSFEERATTFAMLATACARLGFRTKAKQYLRRASENLIGYGYHKDLLLHTALNAVEATAEHFKTRQHLWVRLAPGIDSVLEFTDGDETSHLRARLGKLLLRFDAGLAVDYVGSLMDTEQHSEVEDILREVVRTGDLAAPTVRALVSTCIDPDSLRLLESREKRGEQFATAVLGFTPQFSAPSLENDSDSPTDTDTNLTPDDPVAGPTDRERYLEFAPEDLEQLVQSSASAWPRARSGTLSAWLCCWAETDRAAEALEAAEPYFMEDDRLDISNGVVSVVRKMGGVSRSYRWLVRAQRSNNGWCEYWTSPGEVRERWGWVHRDFPERWHDFLRESIRPRREFSGYFGPTVPRLVEYLILFGRSSDACSTVSQLLDSIRGLVSGQELPTPQWAHKLAEEQ